MTGNMIAVDLGAESGRVVVGCLDGKNLALHELHRFRNGPVQVAGHLHWDVLRIFEEIQHGLALAARQFGEVASLGLNTWGVDFGLLDKTGTLIGNPYHYRDHRTDGVMEQVFARVPSAQVFETTGIQFMQINTLYQLYAMAGSPALEAAQTLLMMPDLFNYWLTGERLGEYTIATTTQFFDTRRNTWAAGLLEELGLPPHLLPRVIPPATEIGLLAPAVADQVGLRGTKVIAPACHDTGSAVAAVPARADKYAYISSGTWSLVGVVSAQPVITDATRDFNFTNEGGVDGTIRLLKNLAGLWPLQECRRSWARAGTDLSYADLTALAERAEPFQAFVDPDHPSFLNPGDMPEAIRAFCTATGQAAPSSHGALVRAALEGLACKYRLTLERLEKITGQRLEVIHVVGGGSQNRLLCQLTADACARPVYAGPVEATALGNILAQAVAGGVCASWAEAREIVRTAFPLESYEPRQAERWDEAYARFQAVTARAAPLPKL
ncbi:MAG: rhamnulokinase [Thermoflexales bacterium]|nr:rhamnulokinase [Thermoflexales bacterium]